MVSAVRRSKDNGRDGSKLKAPDQTDHPSIEVRPEPDNIPGKSLPGERPESKVSDQAVQPPMEDRLHPDNFSWAILPANRQVPNEPRQDELWEYNPEGKSAEELAEEYRNLIGPHPLEEDSDSDAMNATATGPETDNGRATIKSEMTTWTGIMKQASETTTESKRAAQSREKSVPKKQSFEQMSEVQRRIKSIEQAQRRPAPVEAIKFGPVTEAEAFKIAKKKLDILHREGEQRFGESKPLPKVSDPNSHLSRSSGENKPMSKTQTLSLSSSRSSGSFGERKPASPEAQAINVQTSGTRRSSQDIEAETTKSRNVPRRKAVADTTHNKAGLGLTGLEWSHSRS